MKFGGGIHVKLLGNWEFRESRHSESHNSLDVNEVFPYFSFSSNKENSRWTECSNNVLRNCEFREDRHSERQTCFTSGHKLICIWSVRPTFIVQFGWNSVQQTYEQCCWSFTSFVKICVRKAVLCYGRKKFTFIFACTLKPHDIPKVQ